ncbi:hypothetical protein ED733_002228 [Metarhizium rileyi]|uniref:Uncharacterized protein n=1 Tax=Metarhizium rileyi (strain RCEF 4871) TaxID=1649241 RepID=A0A5C6G3A2_METRR|nr:hypothetical protein ED733_002228 [Metarhizium rileyi]
MTPPCHSFPASELPARIQIDVLGRRRKPAPGASSKTDLSACQLLRILQYKCEVERPLSREGAVRCFPVDRLFRRCADGKGSFVVETTAWEGRDARPAGADGEESGKRPFQWSGSWHDGDVAR